MNENHIDISSIKSHIKIEDKRLFKIYLKELFKDLKSQSEQTKKLGLSMKIFQDYMKLPIFIVEKLFKLMDSDNNSYLDLTEFSEGLSTLYLGTFDELISFIFRLCDFNNDGRINYEDIKIILSYLPLKQSKLEYTIQMKSQDEIDQILKETFGNNNEINFQQFQEVTESKYSNVFLLILCFLYEKKPFFENNINLFKNIKKIQLSDSPKQEFQNIKKLIPSPAKISFLSPVHNIIEKNKDLNKSALEKENFNLNLQKIDDDNHADPLIISQKKLVSTSSENRGIENIKYSGIVYKITRNNKQKPYFLSLQANEIYYYKNELKEGYEGMHCLCSNFIKENGEVLVEKDKFYSFSIISCSKTRNFFVKEFQEMKNWVNYLKQAMCYRNIFDYYEITSELGTGKYSTVYLGQNKKSKEKVAIKIVKKSTITESEISLIRTEIDIMKLCQHENVIKLVDQFENAEFIFIVMEYLSGGDFVSYLCKKKFSLPENKVSQFIYQIASGIKYLNKFGIVHRDLKPDNIMLATSDENKVILKIMDFGLSKIMASTESAVDGLGTLPFVAPEVLLRQPYGKKIDVWSIGAILFYALSGTLPFDDENQNEEKIAKLTVFVDIEFNNNKWKNISKTAIDLVKKCLVKNPNERIDVDDILQHQFIKKK